MVLPKLASAVLRNSNARACQQNNNGSRYNVLRSNSPARSQMRDRSNSVKRKQPENSQQPTVQQRSFAHVVSGNLPKSIRTEMIEKYETELAAAKSLHDKAVETCNNIKMQDDFKALFDAIFEAMNALTKSGTTLIEGLKETVTVQSGSGSGAATSSHDGQIWGPTPQQASMSHSQQQNNMLTPTFAILGSKPKQPRFEPALNRQSGSTAAPTDDEDGETEDDYDLYRTVETIQADPMAAKRKRFRKVVEEAERSTLVLNLNLGRTRIVNPETISTNVSLALNAMAAKVDNQGSTIPSNEAIEKIDDIVSVAKKMSFYGKSTKSVRDSKDPTKNGSYCTIPVKYEFRDKATKLFAEETLRDTCNAQCSTPYPTILREAIRQTIANVKKEHPTNLVKIIVDTKRMVLMVSRRPEKGAKWFRYPYFVPIPDACLDVDSRQVPDGFQVHNVETFWKNIDPRASSNSGTTDEDMSTDSTGGQGSPPK